LLATVTIKIMYKVQPYIPFRNNVRVLFVRYGKNTYMYGTRTVKMQLHFVELATFHVCNSN